MTDALWALGRGTGIVALVLLTLTVVLGVLARSGRDVGGLGRFGVAEVHRAAALTGTGLVAVHVTSLLFDPYAQLRLVDLVLPFAGALHPLWLGLGTLAVDLLLVITLTGLLRQHLGPRLFHTIHLATYALWPIALLHALGTGSDAGTTWMRAVALGCTITVGAAVGWRVSAGFAERGHQRRPRLSHPPLRKVVS